MATKVKRLVMKSTGELVEPTAAELEEEAAEIAESIRLLDAAMKAAEDNMRRWWQEFERLGDVLGRRGPDEICCGGLSQRQCAILRTLVEREGAPIGDLAAASGITPSAMTRVLERLEARHLVERVRGGQKDGRSALVRITESGREVRRQLDLLMIDRTAQIVRELPVAKREMVRESIQLLNDAMESGSCCPLNTPVESLQQNTASNFSATAEHHELLRAKESTQEPAKSLHDNESLKNEVAK